MPFVLMTVSFALQKIFSFRRSHLFIVALIVCVTGVICRRWPPVLKCCSLLPTFPSIGFSVVRFILRSLIHLDLSFVHGDRYGFIFILLQVNIQLCQHHLLKMLSFFHCMTVLHDCFAYMYLYHVCAGSKEAREGVRSLELVLTDSWWL